MKAKVMSKLICESCAKKFNLEEQFNESDLATMVGMGGPLCGFCGEADGGREILIVGTRLSLKTSAVRS